MAVVNRYAALLSTKLSFGKGGYRHVNSASRWPAPASTALCVRASIADCKLSGSTVPPKYYVDDYGAMWAAYLLQIRVGCLWLVVLHANFCERSRGQIQGRKHGIN